MSDCTEQPEMGSERPWVGARREGTRGMCVLYVHNIILFTHTHTYMERRCEGGELLTFGEFG